MSKPFALPDTKPGLGTALKALPFAARFLWQVDALTLAASWLLTLLELPLSALGVLAMQGLANGLLGGDWEGAFRWALGMLALESVTLVRGDLAMRWNSRMRYATAVALRQRVLEHQQRLPYAVLEDPAFQALVAAVRSRIHVFWDLQISFRKTLQGLLRVLGLGTLVFIIPWQASAALLGAQAILFFSYARATVLTWALFTMEQREGRRALYMQEVLGHPDALLAARSMGLHQPFLARWVALSTRMAQAKLAEIRQSANGQLLGDVADWAGLVAGTLLTMVGVMDGTTSPSAAIVFLSSYKQLAAALSGLSETLREMQEESTYLPTLERYFEVEEEPHSGVPVPAEPMVVEFKGVRFNYPGAEQETLKGVDLVLREGERVALCGVNGAGKTTLLKLLLGAYPPSSGSILVNGVPLGDLAPEGWRAALSVMTQHDPEYSDPLDVQVRYGNLDGPVDAAAFDAAVELAGLGGVAAEFPHGMATMAGKTWAMPEDHAVKLSGGQKQVLAIARTAYRKARIYVLDEPTSAVDPEKEEAFFERLPKAMAGRMVIFVSHRFSTLRRAERILVFEHGRVLEDGTHDALMAQGGRYRELFLLQAKQYEHAGDGQQPGL